MVTEPLIAYFIEVWNCNRDDEPLFKKEYTASQKKRKELLCADYQERFENYQQTIRNGKNQFDSDKFFNALGRFMKDVYDYSDETLAIVQSPEIIAVSRAFYDRSRSFDLQLKQEEIFQAMRNVWIMNGLQVLLGMPVELTPSIFAYSLLYPYSDNILDDRHISHQEKLAFSQRFEKRLQGTGRMGENRREEKISELVCMIENQYPRVDFPGVYDSLLAIHNAQTRSLGLIEQNNHLAIAEILSICFDKGGSSVLADGFLLAGNPSTELQRFFFGFGIWLQLVDDIQDLAEDISSGTRTLFAMENPLYARTNLVNQTFHFGRAVMEEARCCPADVVASFSQGIIHSTELMLIQAVGLNAEYYPSEYSAKMERFSPVSFAYLREAKNRGLTSRMQMIAQWMETNQSPYLA
jgi:hypothetical protein